MSQRSRRVQPYTFGTGVLLTMAGLAWAGTVGAPRKTFDAVLGTGYSTAMNLMGVGAAVTRQ